jgi:hypothetical protein
MNQIKFIFILILYAPKFLTAQDKATFNTGFCLDISAYAFAPLYNKHNDPIFGPLLPERRNAYAVQLDLNGMSDKKISPFMRVRVGKHNDFDFEQFKKHVEAFYPGYYVDLTSLRQTRTGIMQVLFGAALRPAPRRISAQPYFAGGLQLGSYGETNGAYLKARNSHELIEIHFRPEQGRRIHPFLEAGGKLLIAFSTRIGVHINASCVNFIHLNRKYAETQTNWLTETRQNNLLATPDFYFGFAGSVGLHLKLFDL